jgi:hypothetical protein
VGTGITTTTIAGTLRTNQGNCVSNTSVNYGTAPAGNLFNNGCTYSVSKLHSDANSTGQQVVYNSNQDNTVYDPDACMHNSYTHNPCNTSITNFSTVCPSCVSISTFKTTLSALDAELEGLEPEDEDYDALQTERNLTIAGIVDLHVGIGAYDSAAWLLNSYGKYAEALPFYMAAGLWTDAYTAYGNLPTSNDEEKLYKWLRGLELNLYSNDSSWNDLDSLSRDSLSHIVQVNSASGYLAGAVANLLGIAPFDWQDPEFDTTFVSGFDSTLARIRPSEPEIPGISNLHTGERRFAIYPNPTNGNFIVDCAGGTLSLVSIDGRVLEKYEASEGKTELRLPASLSPGIYLLRYTAANGSGNTLTRLVYQP